MNGGETVNCKSQTNRRFSEHALPEQEKEISLDEFNVRTGIDVSADSPGAAVLAAIKEMEIRDPEAFCFEVGHLQSGRKWEGELLPSGEIEIEEWKE